MLKLARYLAVALLVAAGAVVPSQASAANGGCDGLMGGVICTVQAGNGGVVASPDGAASGSGRTRQAVDHQWGIRYQEDYFAGLPVIDGRECFNVTPATPQPAREAPIWAGNATGAIYECHFYNFTTRMTGVRQFWAGSITDVPVTSPPPDPAQLAQQAVAQMGLSSTDIGIVPEDGPGMVGIIGLPVWMWVADPGPATTGPVTTSVTAAIWTVTATATLDRIVWDMGDGTTVTCYGRGTPYEDRYGVAASPDCGHTYTVPGTYTVSATSYWTANWSGIGRTGTIPLQFTSTTQIVEAEVQVLNQ